MVLACNSSANDKVAYCLFQDNRKRCMQHFSSYLLQQLAVLLCVPFIIYCHSNVGNGGFKRICFDINLKEVLLLMQFESSLSGMKGSCLVNANFCAFISTQNPLWPTPPKKTLHFKMVFPSSLVKINVPGEFKIFSIFLIPLIIKSTILSHAMLTIIIKRDYDFKNDNTFIQVK